MIRVAIDARRLQDRPLTGVGRWISNLLPHLVDDFETVLLTDQRRASPDVAGAEVVPLSVPGPLPEPFWLQVAAARWLRRFEGVFHGTYNAVPLAYRGRSVVSLYDLSWEHHPEDLSGPKRASFLVQARLSARRAGMVLTVSDHARQSIIDTYGLDPARVVSAPPSVDSIFSPQRAQDVMPILERLGVEGRYIVALGGAKRRGLEVAVGAWRKLNPADRPLLVVVGGEPPVPAPGVVFAGRVDDAEWSALLAGALAFCYPTRFEGFGLPALEAAASGTPVVCAPVGPLPEVLGDAAQWCRSPSIDDIAEGLRRLVNDSELLRSLGQAGLAVAAASPSWSDAAATVGDAYRTAARR